MTILRRFLVVQVLMLWQGGFLFYASFVVPTGTEVLDSSAAQGSITARVTDSMNRIGVAGLAVLAWDLLAAADPSRRRRTARWSLWLIAACCQAALFILHARLDAMMDTTRTFVVQRRQFYGLHGVYLWTSTAQWVACLAYTWLTLQTWRNEKPIGAS
jgi:hypothetical protein